MRSHFTFTVAACAWLAVGSASSTFAQSGSIAGTVQSGTSVTVHAKGMFDVKLVPQPADDNLSGVIERMSADKQYHGDLEGSAKGQCWPPAHQ